MIANVHIGRKTLIRISLLIALTVELTIFGAAAFAQNYGTGLLPPPSAGSAGTATVPSASAPPPQPSLPSTAGIATQLGITATLLAVPVNGRGPLTVDFYVGLANPDGSLGFS